MEEKKKIYQKWWSILLAILVYTAVIIAGTYFITSNIVQETFAEDKNDNTNTNNVAIGQVQANENNKAQEKMPKEVVLDNAIQEKDWEITIKEVGFKQDIIPSNPNSFYTHYQVKDTNNTYFYIILDAKNISTLGLRADSIAKIKMKYDNKYEYDTFSTIEESGGGTFSYTNITNIDPLTTRKIYYLVEVPKTIAEENETAVEAEITINNNTYLLKIR